MNIQHRNKLIVAFALSCVTAAVLAACTGTSNTQALPPVQVSSPSPSPTVMPSPSISPSSTELHADQGSIVGQDDMFNPVDGDTANGGQGSPVDGITCDTVMSGNYHVHVYVGVIVNGVHYALPDTIGMVNPSPEPTDGFTNGAQCFYHIHTHDASGIVHLEDPDPSGVPVTGTLFTLKNVLDVWGIAIDNTHVGQFTGPVVVMTSGQVYRGNQNGGVVFSTDYTFYAGDPNGIPLYSHEVIWLMVGPVYPSSLDSVAFYTQY